MVHRGPIHVGLPQETTSFNRITSNPRRGGIRRERLRVEMPRETCKQRTFRTVNVRGQQRVRLALRWYSELYTTTMDRRWSSAIEDS